MGLGQQARIREGRLCHRPRYTPKKPGEESGPAFSDPPSVGTESPRLVLTGAGRTGEQVSTGDDAGRDSPRSPRREEARGYAGAFPPQSGAARFSQALGQWRRQRARCQPTRGLQRYQASPLSMAPSPPSAAERSRDQGLGPAAPFPERAPSPRRASASETGRWVCLGWMAAARIREEPGVGTPHAGICAGAVGPLAVLRRWRHGQGGVTYGSG
jgi:hypothetical protein